ncbi:hypothetical protein [Agrobacterium leguminum]
MVKLPKERLWLLRQFNPYGWSMGRPSLNGVKKWDAHKEALITSGLLEKDQYGMFRLTESGRTALQEAGIKSW